MIFDILISVVLYRNNKTELESFLNSCNGSNLKIHLVFIDNAPGQIDFDFKTLPAFAEYRPMPKNLGYGCGHNVAILDPEISASYHLIANADVRFTSIDLQKIYNKMEASPNCGLLMPQVIWPDGKDQGLRKLLPSPGDLFLRRFVPGFLRFAFKKQESSYQMQIFDSKKEMLVPALSGCFMFCRSSVLREVGGFDERFFLYLEDVDLSRRMGQKALNLYWPEVRIIHEYQKSSYRSLKPLWLHLKSAFKYFNKHGWFFDQERKAINQKAMSQKQ
ncbi:MAG: glycosyltransferase family 2 protein [Croceimicrobium sp.]